MTLAGRNRRHQRSRRRGVGTLIGGTAAGQLVTIAAAPILSRLYLPAEFGTFSIIFGVSVIVASVACGRLELAIVLPEDDGDAFAVAWLALTWLAVTTVTAAAVVLLMGGALSTAFHRPDIQPYLISVPLLVLLIGTFAILNQLAIRHQQYRSIAFRNFLQQSTGSAAQVSAGWAGLGVPGLIAGSAVGQLGGVLALLRPSHLAGPASRAGLRLRGLRGQFVRYRRFPLFLAPAALINNLGQQAPLLLTGLLFGTSAAGWMALTQRVLAVPVVVVGTAVAQVYLGALSRAARSSIPECHSLFRRTSRRLLIIGCIGAVTTAAAAPFLFGAVFGPDWVESGRIAQAMTPYFAAQLLASPLSQTLIVFERVLLQLVWDVLRLVAVVAPVLLCWWTGQSVVATVLALSLGGTLAYLVLWVLCWRTLTRASQEARDRAEAAGARTRPVGK